MHDELDQAVMTLVDERVSSIPSPSLKIDLFINVESCKGISDSFRNIFLTKAIEALDELFARQHVSQL